MTDAPKTLIFLAAAAVLGLLAYVTRPKPFEAPRQLAGDALFADLSAADADALEIVRYDRQQSKPVPLKIKREGENWVIASHNNYPADKSDATTKIRDVTLKLMDLKILGIYSEVTSDHAKAGVISPLSDKVKEADDDDIGLLVALADEQGRNLAQLIIGKEVAGDSGQRFVRKASDAEVYTAKIDISELSSKFSDWIESDLLDVSSFDIRRVTLRDYSIGVRPVRTADGSASLEPAAVERMEAVVDWDNQKSQWQLASLREARSGRLYPSRLADDEELNKEKLDDLKSAIGQLRIVDVESKPKEVVAGLASRKDLLNDEKIGPALVEKGFVPMPVTGDQQELLSINGELRFETADAVEYVLRFGRETGIESGDAEEVKLNRYLLVSTRVAEHQLQPKPETMPPAAATEGPAEDAAGAGGQAGEEGAAGEQGKPEQPQAPPATESPATEGAGEPSADDPAAGGQPPPDGDKPPETAVPKEDETAKKRKEAEEKVARLNQKFGGWYYIISEDVYKKLHLGRFDLIKTKEDSSTGGLDELEELGERTPLPPSPSGESSSPGPGSK